MLKGITISDKANKLIKAIKREPSPKLTYYNNMTRKYELTVTGELAELLVKELQTVSMEDDD